MLRNALAGLLASALLGCGGSPFESAALMPDAAGAAGAGIDSGGAGRGGMGGAGGSAGAAGTGGGGASVLPDAGPPVADAASDSTGNDAFDSGWASDVPYPDASVRDADGGVLPEAARDAVPDAAPAPEAGRDGGGDVVVDHAPDADGAAPKDAYEGGLPPTCDYPIEPVPEVTWPYMLCGATSNLPTGAYQFSELRFRRPFSAPPPIEAFSGGTLTVRNGATLKSYQGQTWRTTMGEEIRFTAEGGADIVFITGVNEITVTSTDISGKRGCLPQPCTWTVVAGDAGAP